MKRYNKTKGLSGALQVSLIALLVLVMLAVFGAMIWFMLIRPIRFAEHYLQVYQNPVTVTATVTEHESYDDDGDRDYRSYISYDYNGVHYDDIQYEDCGDREDLTAVGTVVNVQVSPKDPSQRIDRLKGTGKYLYIGFFLTACALAFLYHFLVNSRMSEDCLGTPDMDTVQRDLKLHILGRLWGAFSFLCMVGYGLMYWRYSPLLGKIPLIIAGVCCPLWLWNLLIGIRDYRYVKLGEFQLHRDVLVNKEIKTDSEGSDSYHLYYQSADRKWDTITNEENYQKAQIGSSVLAVYLKGKNKPTLHYDHRGNAK